MRVILMPVGPPGSGKSTLCNGLKQVCTVESMRLTSTDPFRQFMNAINRPCSVANLDPANDNVPYQDEAAFDVRELVDVEEVMEREQLGPNGGVLWAMEEVETNFDWLEQQLEQCGRLPRVETTVRMSD
jgi:GTPase SAR1 family protein